MDNDTSRTSPSKSPKVSISDPVNALKNMRQYSVEDRAERLLRTETNGESNAMPVVKVLVLFTGGTIGMINTEGRGYEPHPQAMASKLRSLPIFHDEAFVKKYLTPEDQSRYFALPSMAKQKESIIYEVIESDPLLDSSNMTKSDWIKIAKTIEANYDKYEGFVILHGTDTMAYTASALSFMCEHLGKPIILTGSQIPIYEVRSDGRDNFVASLIIAGTYNIPEVMLCFNDRVFRGNRSVKSDASSFMAFTSPNMTPLISLEVDIHVDWNAVFRGSVSDLEKFRVHTDMCENVGVLRLFPGITAQTVKAFLQPPMQGVVLQTYGLGNAPTNRPDILDLIVQACEWGVLIVNISQCSRGSVNPSYATGVALKNAGVIPGGDMTIEAALSKLAYVLSKLEWSAETRKEMLGKNLRGEMTVTLEDNGILDHDLIEGVARTLSLSTSEEVSRLKDALFPTLFCAAAKNGDLDSLEKLRCSGANVSSPNYDGRTALHIACGTGNIQVVQYLLKHGASVHARDCRGETPLMDAILCKCLPVIHLLVKTGAVINWSTMRIACRLCTAAATNDVETIRAWHCAGADVNYCDYDHRTALHIAVSIDRKEVVRFLVGTGAKCNFKDIFGLTPIVIAQNLQHQDLLEIMCPNGEIPTSAVDNEFAL